MYSSRAFTYLKQKLQDHSLYNSSVPSVRYSKEFPQIQSGFVAACPMKQSKPEEGGRKYRSPVYPPLARHVWRRMWNSEVSRNDRYHNFQISATMVNLLDANTDRKWPRKAPSDQKTSQKRLKFKRSRRLSKTRPVKSNRKWRIAWWRLPSK